MKRFISTEAEFKDKSKRMLIYVLTFFISYLILITVIAPKQFKLEVGDIARSDIKAPRDTIDEIATKEKEQEAISKVNKEFTLKTEIEKKAVENIKAFFTKVSNLNATEMDEVAKIDAMKKSYGNTLSDNEYKAFILLTNDELKDLEWKIIKIVDDIYTKRIEDDNSNSLNEAKLIAVKSINNLKLNSNLESGVKKILEPEIKPNFYLDKEKMDEKIKEIQKSTPKVIIKKNQIIVSEGQPVTERQLQIIKELGMLDDSTKGSVVLVYTSLAILVILILYLQYYYIYANKKEIFLDTKKILLISIINLVGLILARAIYIISPYLIPFACAPMLLTLLFDYKISAILSSLNGVLIGVIVNFNPQVILVLFVSIIMGAVSLKKMQQRNDILYSSLVLSIINLVLTLTLGILVSNNIKEILIFSFFSVVGVVFAAILTIGILPFFEMTFDVVTTLKLLELSNPNHPLLKKLIMEAPGTYHHSMLVANLAEMAAEEVGANPVLARIGAYYHDIGKTKRPYFFGENQLGKDNPHNKISPNLSTLIITSHVKDGLELATEYNIPVSIRDIIVQHHGTTLVKYFYYTLKNSAENPDDIKEEDFRYAGPKPSSKEAGIIMLSDSVEAAVRSISEPTKGKIEEMVNNIIKDKLYTGQLDNCDLTLKDLEKIRKCFLKALYGIYHQRVEYPTEKLKANK